MSVRMWSATCSVTLRAHKKAPLGIARFGAFASERGETVGGDKKTPFR